MAVPQGSDKPQCSTICIFGITGKLGSLIAMHLLTQPANRKVKVRGFCRDQSKVSSVLSSSPYFTVYEGESLSAPTIRSVIKGSNSVICAYNNWLDRKWMVEVEKLLIDICEEEGVKRYFPANFTGDFRKLQLHEFALVDPMIEILNYLNDGKRSGKLKNVHPVHLLSAGFTDILFQKFFKFDNLIYYGSGDQKWGFSCYYTAAKFTAEVVVDENEPTGVLRFADFQASLNEVAAAVGTLKRDGESVPMCNAGSQKELEDIITKARSTGNFSENLIPYCHYYFSAPIFGITNDLDNARYPNVQTITLDEAVRKWVG